MSFEILKGNADRHTQLNADWQEESKFAVKVGEKLGFRSAHSIPCGVHFLPQG